MANSNLINAKKAKNDEFYTQYGDIQKRIEAETDIIKFGTKKPFEKYDNYNAIEVSFVKNIPGDYDSVMGVPISFLDKYNPDQFEILGSDYNVKEGLLPILVNQKWKGKLDRGYVNNQRLYTRVLIRHKKK